MKICTKRRSSGDAVAARVDGDWAGVMAGSIRAVAVKTAVARAGVLIERVDITFYLRETRAGGRDVVGRETAPAVGWDGRRRGRRAVETLGTTAPAVKPRPETLPGRGHLLVDSCQQPAPDLYPLLFASSCRSRTARKRA